MHINEHPWSKHPPFFSLACLGEIGSLEPGRLIGWPEYFLSTLYSIHNIEAIHKEKGSTGEPFGVMPLGLDWLLILEGVTTSEPSAGLGGSAIRINRLAILVIKRVCPHFPGNQCSQVPTHVIPFHTQTGTH